MTSPKFQHTTRASFKEQFFERVGDTSRTFWTDTEADLLIKEALYTFGAIGHIWRNQVNITINAGQSFYDITSDLFAEQALLSFNLTYQYIVDCVNFHLLESISLINPVSEVTSLDEILKFARNRINEFQFKTGLILSKKNFTIVSPDNNEVTIDDEILNINRAAYVSLDELFNPDEIFVLNREDEVSIGYSDRSAFNRSVEVPEFYTSVLGNLNTVRVYPHPINLGQIELITTNGLPTSTLLAPATIIPLPDNLVSYIKWGVLADIYAKDGIAFNPAMAAYCEERWREGVIIGNNYSSILEARLDGIPILIDSFASVDNNQSNWQNEFSEPSLLLVAGYNLIAVNCRPEQEHSLQLFAITNAYIPTDDDDFIDIKMEYVNPLLDYCIHLANIKNGAEAVNMVMKNKNNFISTGIKNNLRLITSGTTVESMLKKTKLQEEDDSVRVKEEAA